MKKITFAKRILQGLCCKSKAEASLLCFTGVCGIHPSPQPWELWGLVGTRGALAGPCGVQWTRVGSSGRGLHLRSAHTRGFHLLAVTGLPLCC